MLYAALLAYTSLPVGGYAERDLCAGNAEGRRDACEGCASVSHLHDGGIPHCRTDRADGGEHIPASDRGVQLLSGVREGALRSELRREGLAADWAAVVASTIAGIGMWGYAVVLSLRVRFAADNDGAVRRDCARARTGGRALSQGGNAPRARRITRHLTKMMAGTIATVTAVLVVNVGVEPVWISWILPAIAITPLIVWRNIRLARQSGRRRNA